MRLNTQLRGVAVLLLLGGGMGLAQSTLPAMAPTAPSADAAVAAKAARRAQVVYANGMLEVTADNSSLNQILRDVATQTHMKITGGVVDERVFGKYGPGTPSEILSALLEGTNSNMMLMLTSEKVPAELILTPRQGGVTPPNPNAGADEDTPPAQEVAARPVPQPAHDAATTPLLLPAAVAGSAGFTPAGGTAAAPASSDAGGGDAQKPKTPEQIYQQLQQLQRQQAQPPAAK